MAYTATRCFHSWPDPNSIRTHVCITDGEHSEHVCGACGETCPTSPERSGDVG